MFNNLKEEKSKKFFFIYAVSIVILFIITSKSVSLAGVTVGLEQGVDFEQIDFVFNDLTEEDSDWGKVNIDPVLLTLSTGIASGYLNIFTDTGWVIQNIPIDIISDGVDMVASYFSLGLVSPMDVGTLSAHVEFSPEPEIEFIDGTRSNFAIGSAEWNARGVDDSQGIAIPVAPLPNQISFNADKKNKKHTLPHDVNVETAVNQCGPMAIANSLQYLENKFVFNVPHDHEPGLKGDNTLVGQLDTETGRTASSRTSGKGIQAKDFIEGKFSYLRNNGLKKKLVHKHQGRGMPNAPLPKGNFTRKGITSKNMGESVTFEFICDEIEKEEDVELLFSFDDSLGKTTDGHFVRVYECGKVKGKPFISFLHDKLQSNDSKGTELVKTYVGDFDGDGIINLGSRSLEIRFAMSESLKKPKSRPTPTPTPTFTPTPTPTLTPSPTPTPITTLTPSPTPTTTITSTPIPTPSPTESPIPSPTPATTSFDTISRPETGFARDITPLKISIDIIPDKCPNLLELKATRNKRFSLAIIGKIDFNVFDIDVTSIKLEGIRPVQSSFDFVTEPFHIEPCECNEMISSDVFYDLILHFRKQDFEEVLNYLNDGEEAILTITGELKNGTPLEGSDCIILNTNYPE